MPGLVALIDDKLEYRYLNARFNEWFGIDPADFVGKSPRELLDEESYREVEPLFQKALAGHRVKHEARLLYRFGGPRYVRFYLVPHKSLEGATRGICALAIDISEEMKVRDQAEEALRAKSRFLAAASHDLRQPLHSMTLLTRALERRVGESKELGELVGHMSTALSSLRAMFEAILNISKLDAGLIKPQYQVIALAPLLTNLCQSFSAEAEERGLRLSVMPLDVNVTTDPAILEMAASNLVANALKFTKEGGVLIGCRRRGDNVRLEVYDTGAGIEAAQLNTIFDEFYYHRSAARGANDGLGLGLSIVKRHCDLMGYDLDVKSEFGRGSRFAIAVPIAASEGSESKAARPTVESSASLAGTRILVLDDEPQAAFALSRDLADQGAVVLRADWLEQAEEILAKGDWPDAAVVDYDLRKEEMGDAFVARMEEAAGRSLPTLILTGSTDPDSLRALAASGRRWLTKPVDPRILSAAVAGLLDS